MRLIIKNHPSISSEIVKFVCYYQTLSGTNQVLDSISLVDFLQRGYHSSISKLELSMNKLEAWKDYMNETLKKIITKISPL